MLLRLRRWDAAAQTGADSPTHCTGCVVYSCGGLGRTGPDGRTGRTDGTGGRAGKFPGIFREISGKIPGIFPEKFWEISGNFPGNFREMSRKFPGNLPEIYRKISGSFPEFSRKCIGCVVYSCGGLGRHIGKCRKTGFPTHGSNFRDMSGKFLRFLLISWNFLGIS